MSEMVERVAKTLQSDPLFPISDFIVEKLSRAAIAAMRKPTPEMRIAGGIAWSNALPAAETYVDSADAGWQAMIDAALK